MRSLKIFGYFLYRDFYVNMFKSRDFWINSIILYPLVAIISFGYLLPRTFFTGITPLFVTIIFAGNSIIHILSQSEDYNIGLLEDIEHDRYVDYQITILSPRLVIFERILFSSLFTFLLLLPYYPIGKLLLQSTIDTSNTNWFMIFIMLYLGLFCFCAYHAMAACVMKGSYQIMQLWARFNIPMIMLGGLWVPWYTMKAFSPTVAYILLINPAIYITEGFRQAFVGGDQFLPYWICISALAAYSLIFTLCAFYFFKKKLDHI